MSGFYIPACEGAVRQYPNSARLTFQLGRAYYKAGNLTAAAEQFRKSADLGSAIAQTDLGVMYRDGRGMPKDYGQALLWFREAANQAFAEAQNALGTMYELGQGVPNDRQRAIAWYQKAAENGSPAAHENLARLNPPQFDTPVSSGLFGQTRHQTDMLRQRAESQQDGQTTELAQQEPRTKQLPNTTAANTSTAQDAPKYVLKGTPPMWCRQLPANPTW